MDTSGVNTPAFIFKKTTHGKDYTIASFLQ